MEDKIKQWLADGGEIFVVQEGEGGTKITDYNQLTELHAPRNAHSVVEAIILEKNGDSRKSTNMEQNLEAILAEIEKLMNDF